MSLLDTFSFIKVIFKPVPNSHMREMGIHWSLLQCLVLALDFLPNTPVHLQTYLNMSINDRLHSTGFAAFPLITGRLLQLTPSHENSKRHSRTPVFLVSLTKWRMSSKRQQKVFSASAAGPLVTAAKGNSLAGSSEWELARSSPKQNWGNNSFFQITGNV